MARDPRLCPHRGTPPRPAGQLQKEQVDPQPPPHQRGGSHLVAGKIQRQQGEEGTARTSGAQRADGAVYLLEQQEVQPWALGRLGAGVLRHLTLLSSRLRPKNWSGMRWTPVLSVLSPGLALDNNGSEFPQEQRQRPRWERVASGRWRCTAQQRSECRNPGRFWSRWGRAWGQKPFCEERCAARRLQTSASFPVRGGLWAAPDREAGPPSRRSSSSRPGPGSGTPCACSACPTRKPGARSREAMAWGPSLRPHRGAPPRPASPLQEEPKDSQPPPHQRGSSHLVAGKIQRQQGEEGTARTSGAQGRMGCHFG
ncbi:uncharacterized protein [Physeter macrocephalus]|uniref:Uncharacterized protein n=1 Tax=Physeter macrocephalus TaxID=9755 RepID=A0A455B104_PHYMC|nr:uncharacterized protein LOC114484618 [Physeter catodon]|eukprot:XP_028337766.1 uncharacterized protein LOC114484618 [Physeter catodon]